MHRIFENIAEQQRPHTRRRMTNMWICFSIFYLSFNDKSQGVFKLRKKKKTKIRPTTEIVCTNYLRLWSRFCIWNFIFSSHYWEFGTIDVHFIEMHFCFSFWNLEPESYRMFLVEFRKSSRITNHCQVFSIDFVCRFKQSCTEIYFFSTEKDEKQKTEPDQIAKMYLKI